MSDPTQSEQQDTVGTTLDGATLPPDEDPHVRPDTDRDADGSSLYPVELTVGFNCEIEDNGRTFVTPFIQKPAGKHDLPSSRYNEIRDTLQKRFNMEAPPIGTIGTVVVTEDDHHIRLDDPAERDAIPFAQWLLENLYKAIAELPAAAFGEDHNPISADDVNNVEEALLDILPGELTLVGGECNKCGEQVRELKYMTEDQDQRLAMCDCGVGTSYPRLDREEEPTGGE